MGADLLLTHTFRLSFRPLPTVIAPADQRPETPPMANAPPFHIIFMHKNHAVIPVGYGGFLGALQKNFRAAMERFHSTVVPLDVIFDHEVCRRVTKEPEQLIPGAGESSNDPVPRYRRNSTR